MFIKVHPNLIRDTAAIYHPKSSAISQLRGKLSIPSRCNRSFLIRTRDFHEKALLHIIKEETTVFNLLKVEQAAVQVSTGHNQAHNGYTRRDHTGRSLSKVPFWPRALCNLNLNQTWPENKHQTPSFIINENSIFHLKSIQLQSAFGCVSQWVELGWFMGCPTMISVWTGTLCPESKMCCNHRESAREQKWLKTDAGEKDRLHNVIKYDFCLFQAHAQFLFFFFGSRLDL